jgi:hypothetical protein
MTTKSSNAETLWAEWESLQTGGVEPFETLKHEGIFWRFRNAKDSAVFKQVTKDVPVGDRFALGLATNQKLTDKTKSAWFPKLEIRERRD